ncbi:MAG: M28 family metallopeptidase [Candidatus Hermodarchaeota archaeon]
MKLQELNEKIVDKTFINMNLDIDNAYKITERLAFPRLVGTEGEKKAITIVSEEFKKAGYNPIYKESFKTSLYVWNILRYAFIPSSICLILLALSFFINPWLSLLLILLNVYICAKILSLSTSSETKLFKNEKKNYLTQNIYTDLKSKNSKAKVIFIGHWDSKSQTFPTSTRLLLFIVTLFSFILVILIYLVFSIIRLIIPFNNLILNIVMLYGCIVISIISNFSYFNKTENKSPGAYDNAAAVGAIIELARFYKNNPINNIDFIFLCPSSEELNLGGAKHFIQSHKEEFDKKSTYFINLDPIGGNELIRLITSYGIPRRSSSQKLNKLFLKSANKLKIDIKDIYLPTGMWSDYMPIVQEGFEACWLGSQPGLKYVHTKKDNMKLVSKEGIRNVLFLCVDVVNELDDEFDL